MQKGLSESPELFIGLVAPLGVDLKLLTDCLRNSLHKVNYEPLTIRVSETIKTTMKETLEFRDDEIKEMLSDKPEHVRIWTYMNAGNMLRKVTGEKGYLAMTTIVAIQKARVENINKPRRAYIIRSLKNPGELEILRSTYGRQFFLIAGNTYRSRRVENLATSISLSLKENISGRHRRIALSLIEKDEAETDPEFGEYGQHVREVFPEADIFVNVTDSDRLQKSLDRFIDLLFGSYKFHTPTKDEYAMFHAYAAALRSSNPSRQVGAVIATEEGDIIAVGTNEVPRLGGGLYWCDDDRGFPDFKKGYDSNKEMKKVLLRDILTRLRENRNWLRDEKQEDDINTLTEKAYEILRDAKLMDILEFGRTVHAEMAALMDAARRTVSVKGATLYSTTFPCHECTKHIIAAGIKRVVYIEPYPKSKAEELYRDYITINGNNDRSEHKIVFEAFEGISPRIYIQLFTFRKHERQIPIEASIVKNNIPRYHESKVAIESKEKEIMTRLKRLNNKLKENKAKFDILKHKKKDIEEKYRSY